jgi:predicted thioesterase
MEGASATVLMAVGDDDLATAFGSGDVGVLATPRLVALVEEAAVAAIADRLEPGFTSVGIRVDLRHLAPSPPGSEVLASATVTAANPRRVSFKVEAVMRDQVVATGIHDRAIVRRSDFPG